MTTGMFLQELVGRKQNIYEWSHVVLDEIHERQLDTDFVMVTLKHLILKGKTKLVLMSASFDA